jgi:hypothetical protein
LKNKTIVHGCVEYAKGLLKHHQFASSFEQRNFMMGFKKENKLTIQFIMLLL